MFDRPQAAASSSVDDGPSRVHIGGPPLRAGLERALAGAVAWRERARASKTTDAWLLHVPDVGPTCEVLLADRLFHDLRPAERDGLLAFVRGSQADSGAWLDAHGEPDLSLTTLGWWVLRDAGDDPRSEPMLRAQRVVHQLGGAQRANFSVRLWLAMGGQIPWTWLPAIPSELFLLPPHVLLSPSRFSPWARGMLTPYFVIARAPARLQLPDATALLLPHNDGQPMAPRLTRPGLAGDLLQAFDRTVKLARKLPRGPLPRLATRRALAFIDEHQQGHGGWFSVRPTLLSLVALRVMGATSSDARLRRGLDHLRRGRGRARIPQGRGAGEVALAQGIAGPSLDVHGRLLACGPTEPELAWLLRQELTLRGPWQARADAATGGFPFESGATHHLDVDGTCTVLHTLASLPEVAGPTPGFTTAIWATSRRALDVLLAMQEPDGRFSRFERGESDVLMQQLPWTDADLLAHGRTDDDEHVRTSARVLATLSAAGFRIDDDRMARGLRWLEHTLGPRMHEHVTTGRLSTVAALAEALGPLTPTSHPLRRELEQRLRVRQHEDGGFGPIVDTAHALQAMLALGLHDVQTQRAAAWLATRAMRDRDGELASWSQPVDRGLGLSPAGFDPSAGPRETAIALQAYLATKP
ncbi:hypothetical protein [Paraliomyxa miuraensis]|uniref:hypothetical protein n=1 Tax=Paraliomyxa miuraensis TaxID=376150 RepID=UPI00225B48A6|nr:hypothetical protein [Paraliomyxa miuraensis]MCX4242832.1 hypothetical protein [Paraliomyxa miuraensis]